MDTSGGNITLVLPHGAAEYDVNARTAGGEVTDSLPINSSSRRQQLTTATTGGGNVTLREAP